ncbi:MAG TPA: hypothetical protein VF432_29475 [Thermoanaerobaculia bacterium]
MISPPVIVTTEEWVALTPARKSSAAEPLLRIVFGPELLKVALNSAVTPLRALPSTIVPIGVPSGSVVATSRTVPSVARIPLAALFWMKFTRPVSKMPRLATLTPLQLLRMTIGPPCAGPVEEAGRWPEVSTRPPSIESPAFPVLFSTVTQPAKNATQDSQRMPPPELRRTTASAGFGPPTTHETLPKTSSAKFPAFSTVVPLIVSAPLSATWMPVKYRERPGCAARRCRPEWRWRSRDR